MNHSKPIFPELQNDRLLRAARGEFVDRVPVWMMRQAGRYLPEYRKAREGHSFFETCRDAELVSEITIQPVRRFPIDAAIIFSDILVVPLAMGMQVDMVAGEGPVFPEPLNAPADLDRLVMPDVEDELGYVFQAIEKTRRDLNGRVPLIGFSGAPWTLMCYMVEGAGSKTFPKPRAWLYAEPQATDRLLEQLTDVIIEYLKGQIQAGAQYIQVFESWAGVLGPEAFERFEAPHLKRIATELKQAYPEIPLAVFPRGAHHALRSLADSDYDVLSVDWTISPEEARAKAGPYVALQGNLDPAVLYGPAELIRENVRIMVQAFGTSHYIANLGHGMMPDHDPDKAAVFVEAVQEFTSELELSSSH